MKPLVTASLLSFPALACSAGAGSRCDLYGLQGAEVLVRYPIPHPPSPGLPYQHRVDHVPWSIASGPAASPESMVSTNDSRVIGIGDFIPGGSCDLLWEESAPESSPSSRRSRIRVAVTEGFTAAPGSVFARGVTRPPLPWDVAGVFDVTDDGRADVLWWNPGTGSVLLWIRTADGWTEAGARGALPAAEEAEPSAATAIVRFEAAGDPAIVWQPSVNASVYRYFRTSWNGHDLQIEDAGVVQGLFGGGYSLAAVGDFDDDGDDDLLLQNMTDTTLRVCYMNGPALRQPCASLFPPTFALSGYHHGWSVAGPR